MNGLDELVVLLLFCVSVMLLFVWLDELLLFCCNRCHAVICMAGCFVVVGVILLSSIIMLNTLDDFMPAAYTNWSTPRPRKYGQTPAT